MHRGIERDACLLSRWVLLQQYAIQKHPTKVIPHPHPSLATKKSLLPFLGQIWLSSLLHGSPEVFGDLVQKIPGQIQHPSQQKSCQGRVIR